MRAREAALGRIPEEPGAPYPDGGFHDPLAEVALTLDDGELLGKEHPRRHGNALIAVDTLLSGFRFHQAHRRTDRCQSAARNRGDFYRPAQGAFRRKRFDDALGARFGSRRSCDASGHLGFGHALALGRYRSFVRGANDARLGPRLPRSSVQRHVSSQNTRAQPFPAMNWVDSPSSSSLGEDPDSMQSVARLPGMVPAGAGRVTFPWKKALPAPSSPTGKRSSSARLWPFKPGRNLFLDGNNFIPALPEAPSFDPGEGRTGSGRRGISLFVAQGKAPASAISTGAFDRGCG